VDGEATGECEVAPEPADPFCDYDYFEYVTVIDVKNVLEHTVTGLVKGETYFFAATAYNDKHPARDTESKYSDELKHVVTSISTVIDLRIIPPIKGE
jgi:hypothetical protein